MISVSGLDTIVQNSDRYTTPVVATMAVQRAMLHLHEHGMLLLAVAVAVAVAVAASGATAAKVPATYVFGDSTADVGNNDYLRWSIAKANFPHNGVDFPGGTATGRFSNGLIGVDYLAIAMGFSGSPPPYLSFTAAAASNSSRSSEVTRNTTMAAAAAAAAAYMSGANFASGGSGLLDSTGSTISMTQQIGYFSELKDQMSTRLSSDKVADSLSKSIFLISAGSNDAFDFFSENRSPGSTEIQQFSQSMISTYDSHVKTLYHLGARKFAVINVPLIGCCPFLRSQNPTGECAEKLNQIAKSLNDGIKDLFSNLSSEMQDMKYSIGNAYQLVSSLIQSPHSAGLEEVKSACCGGGRLNAEIACTPISRCCSDRSKYLFWDLLHPTQATSKFAGHAFYDGPAQFVSPISIKQLVEA